MPRWSGPDPKSREHNEKYNSDVLICVQMYIKERGKDYLKYMQLVMRLSKETKPQIKHTTTVNVNTYPTNKIPHLTASEESGSQTRQPAEPGSPCLPQKLGGVGYFPRQKENCPWLPNPPDRQPELDDPPELHQMPEGEHTYPS